jgi:uncharacterized protein
MKTLFIILLLCCIPLAGNALEVPPLRAHVNDYAGMVSAQTATQLEEALTRFEQTDSTQVVVVTIPSLEGENLEEFSIKVADVWKIGRAKIDNGVILLIVKNDRKVRIEVGRGLEGILTDLVSGRIIRNTIAPRFKQGDYDGGVVAGVAAIVDVIRGEYRADQGAGQGRKTASPIFALLIFLFVALVFAGAISKIFGAAVGAAGLPGAAKIAFPMLSLPVLGVLLFVGVGLGLFVSLLFGGSRHQGKGGGFFPPMMGGGFGSSRFGGFSGGGGFGGGGGGFGGGGASGDW